MSVVQLPRHIAIIMDGNGRWANLRDMPRHEGHREGIVSVRAIVEVCVSKKIPALTLFAFSSENWQRPSSEIEALMSLFLLALNQEVQALHSANIRLRFIGDLTSFSTALQSAILEAGTVTRNNDGLQLIIALNYGGRWDITQAMRQIAQQVSLKTLSPHEINQETIQHYLMLSDLPEPDLFIRTSGEQRISNFFLWQLAYTELYFTNSLWPDFREIEFEEALAVYAKRQRRYGKSQENRGKEITC